MNIEHLRKLTLEMAQMKRVGPVSFLNLLSRFENVQQIYSYLRKEKGLTATIPGEVLLGKINRLGIDFVCIWEEHYPEILKQIQDPPIVLFYKGELRQNLFKRSIAIVGTRKSTEEGEELTISIARQLSERGYTIVSGMAFGIDAAAHRGALSSGGKTCAVLATPAHIPSPTGNEKLYSQILSEGGLVVSEVFPDTEFAKGLFPKRNRIIAGLTSGVLIAEAGERSGALITGHLAFDYGRQVFAIPGDIKSHLHKGTNKLIKQGKAKLVETAEDILVEVEHGYQLNPEIVDTDKKKQDLLSIQEKEVLDSIKFGSSFAEEISKELDKSLPHIVSLLSMLEVGGFIFKKMDGSYGIT